MEGSKSEVQGENCSLCCLLELADVIAAKMALFSQLLSKWFPVEQLQASTGQFSLFISLSDFIFNSNSGFK